MSQLSLIPNPTVIVVQAGIFLSNMFVVKKLILDPYLKVRAARDQSTGGSQEDAQKIIATSRKLDEAITAKMREAQKIAASTREKIKTEANQNKASIIAAAEDAAKKEQLNVEQAITANLNEERAKKDQIVQTLTTELVKLATN